MIEIKQVERQIQFDDVVIVYDIYLARVLSNKCRCGTNRDGFWVKWSSTNKEGAFYSTDEKTLKQAKVVEIYVNGKILSPDEAKRFVKKVIKMHIVVDKETLQLSWDFLVD